MEKIAPEVQDMGFRQFTGFPYIMTRIVSALYHVILLPDELSEGELFDLAVRQAKANMLPTALALGRVEGYYISNGRYVTRNTPPLGGTLVQGQLLPPWDYEISEGYAERLFALNQLIESELESGGLLGDLTKGGRPATPEERVALGGTVSGIPRGLERCRDCGCLKGRCLDPDPGFAGMVMEVHCLCDNWNRCAHCGNTLYEWRLNANYFDESDRNIWHVPGFCAFSHRCQ